MNLKNINFGQLDRQLLDLQYENIIYGAGYNGKLLYGLLEERGISITAFYDDDVTRVGEQINDCKILSIKELLEKENSKTNIIISSMYVPQIYAKCVRMGFNNIFFALDVLLDKDTKLFQFDKYKDNLEYVNRLESLETLIEDELSKKYFQVIRKAVKSGKAIKEICDVYCNEDQYFLECFNDKLDGLIFLDGGAYTGDTLRVIENKHIKFSNIYCFEAEELNYEKLRKFSLGKNIVVENLALWDRKTRLAMKNSNYNARIDMESRADNIEAITINEYFKNKKIDFIKMDIEGAEYNALIGGMDVICRDRPILAISIYHGLEDIVRIPELLFGELDNYYFMVRHHSYTYSETILYGIPVEKNLGADE